MRRPISAIIATLWASLSLSIGALAQIKVDSFKIGVIQSLTGLAAEDGRAVVDGIELAVDQLVEKENLHIVRIIEDDQSQSKNTVSSFHSLGNQGVDLIIGGTWDFLANAIIPLSGQQKLVLLTVSAPLESLDLTRSNGYAFAIGPTIASEAQAFDLYLTQEKVKSIAIVFANNSWGESQRKIYRQLAEARQVEISGEVQSVAYDSNDWRVFVTKIKALNADVAVLLLNKADIELFLKRASEIDYKPRVFGSKNLSDSYRATSLKELFNGACYPYPQEQLNQNKKFLQVYRSRYREEPRLYSDSAYDSAFIAVRAMQLARKEDIPLLDAIRRVRYTGVVGEYSYSPEKSLSQGRSSLVCVDSEGVELR